MTLGEFPLYGPEGGGALTSKWAEGVDMDMRAVIGW